MGSFLWADGRRLSIDGITRPTEFNVYAQVQLASGLQPVEIRRGTYLSLYRGMQLPPHVQLGTVREFSQGQGTLATAELRMSTPDGGARHLIWAAWEGTTGVVHMTAQGRDYQAALDLFGELAFRETPDGIVVDNPVDESVRPMRGLFAHERLGMVTLIPRGSPAAEANVPRNSGAPAAGGSVYALPDKAQAYMLVTPTTILTAQPLPDTPAGASSVLRQVSVTTSS